MMCRSPGGAPVVRLRPCREFARANQFQLRRECEPSPSRSSASCLCRCTSEQGERRRPVPPQSGHSCANRKRPPARCTWPEPLHVGQTITGPPMSPAPLQREHCSERLTVMFVVSPLIASSNESARGISMSAPRLRLRPRRFLLFRRAAAKQDRQRCRGNCCCRRRRRSRAAAPVKSGEIKTRSGATAASMDQRRAPPRRQGCRSTGQSDRKRFASSDRKARRALPSSA